MLGSYAADEASSSTRGCEKLRRRKYGLMCAVKSVSSTLISTSDAYFRWKKFSISRRTYTGPGRLTLTEGQCMEIATDLSVCEQENLGVIIVVAVPSQTVGQLNSVSAGGRSVLQGRHLSEIDIAEMANGSLSRCGYPSIERRGLRSQGYVGYKAVG